MRGRISKELFPPRGFVSVAFPFLLFHKGDGKPWEVAQFLYISRTQNPATSVSPLRDLKMCLLRLQIWWPMQPPELTSWVMVTQEKVNISVPEWFSAWCLLFAVAPIAQRTVVLIQRFWFLLQNAVWSSLFPQAVVVRRCTSFWTCLRFHACQVSLAVHSWQIKFKKASCSLMAICCVSPPSLVPAWITWSHLFSLSKWCALGDNCSIFGTFCVPETCYIRKEYRREGRIRI